MLLGIQAFTLDVGWQFGLDMLLKEMLTSDPGRIPIERERSIAQVVEQVVRQLSEVLEEIALRDGRVPVRGGPEYSVEMADGDVHITNLQLAHIRLVELVEDGRHDLGYRQYAPRRVIRRVQRS
jgi:hypothetical protein